MTLIEQLVTGLFLGLAALDLILIVSLQLQKG